jgi:hypothetical protein
MLPLRVGMGKSVEAVEDACSTRLDARFAGEPRRRWRL